MIRGNVEGASIVSLELKPRAFRISLSEIDVAELEDSSTVTT